ncbi:hypothetical protein GALMADRAFT_1041668 [Galerina marginata CBS 339.88]|uniref:Uncharacterized protein n=1 Tax=Galerina marginata (strain CBS 339.88) TaxID=685588 RepID=A0A067SBW8_GALM3|nr:hypothetical protein GALMADRAFT_1041668 [Galerina marginata CBS 339.88]
MTRCMPVAAPSVISAILLSRTDASSSLLATFRPLSSTSSCTAAPFMLRNWRFAKLKPTFDKIRVSPTSLENFLSLDGRNTGDDLARGSANTSCFWKMSTGPRTLQPPTCPRTTSPYLVSAQSTSAFIYQLRHNLCLYAQHWTPQSRQKQHKISAHSLGLHWFISYVDRSLL